MLKELKAGHKQDCEKQSHCLGCNGWMTAAQFETHKETCSLRKCSQCKSEKQMTPEELEEHLTTCTKERRCHKCSKIFQATEGHKCPLARCSLCHCLFNPSKSHLCTEWRCFCCKAQMPFRTRLQHRCPKKICPSYGLHVLLGKTHEHVCKKFIARDADAGYLWTRLDTY